ncbi:MAG: hypothetical protein J6B04_04670 [Clostridia bacterium]|nr:hypothetical protein [Clostridia bacterium]
MQLKLYLIIIFACSVLSSVIVSLAYNLFFFTVLGATFLGVVIIIAIDGLTATVCRLLPKRVANFNCCVYAVKAGEKNFYEKLKIRRWKEKIPEIGHFTGFRKNKIAEPKNAEYIERFLMEICYGELGHFASIFTGFSILALPWFSPFWLVTALVVAVVNAFLNVLPVIVLRYNSYKLLILYKSLKK